MATQADLDTVRDWVGTDDPSDDSIQSLIDSLGTPLLAAQRILKRRLADFEAESASMSVTGFSYNNSANISAIEKKLEALAVLTGGDADGDGVPDTNFLVRPDRCRR